MLVLELATLIVAISTFSQVSNVKLSSHNIESSSVSFTVHGDERFWDFWRGVLAI